ncbi:SRPBCC family protein [Nonomuraea basaltis]|uniref:SRPBCC family protein n=1 Tax=Nonomuraea basaltis TaxID=2495887 RepID=UPI001485FD83|nr:SRPBCC family protein [Nonomuraea basaltis]
MINRPAGEVFKYLADLENLPRWNYAIAETQKVSPGSPAQGTVYLQTRTLPRPMQETLEISRYEPDRLLAVTGGFGDLEGTSTYTLEPNEGATRLTNEIRLEGRGLLRVVSALATANVRQAVAQNLAVLKNLLESAAGTP